MKSFPQSFVTCIGIFTILSFCQCSDFTDADEYLQKVEKTNLGVKKLATLLANELLKEEKAPIETEKRVFCNGFFGCSNGRKRSESMDLNPLNFPMDATEPEPKTNLRKRLFCNQVGCFGGKKRSASERFFDALRKSETNDDM